MNQGFVNGNVIFFYTYCLKMIEYNRVGITPQADTTEEETK